MENKKTAGKSLASTKKTVSKTSTNASMQTSQLMKLFEHELKDIFWAEKALTKAIPKMI